MLHQRLSHQDLRSRRKAGNLEIMGQTSSVEKIPLFGKLKCGSPQDLKPCSAPGALHVVGPNGPNVPRHGRNAMFIDGAHGFIMVSMSIQKIQKSMGPFPRHSKEVRQAAKGNERWHHNLRTAKREPTATICLAGWMKSCLFCNTNNHQHYKYCITFRCM